MLIPLGVLTIGAVFSGFVYKYDFIDGADFWGGSIYFNEALMHALHGVPLWVKLTATVVMLLGLLIAWFAYIKDPSIPAKTREQLGPIYSFVYNKWYFDELYNFLFVKPAFWIGKQFWKIGDVGIVDRFGPNGAAWVVAQGSALAKKVQTGYVYSYALVMLLGLVAAVSWVLI